MSTEPTISTVFGHIVQKRYSQEYENIATDALAFILRSKSARSGIMKLLRGIAPALPSLQFRTQQTQDDARPDMWGYDGNVPRVFIENKFWTGLTENQPVGYLKRLAKHHRPSVLLVVVPAARQETVWRELLRRVEDAKARAASRDVIAGGVRSIVTKKGPILALTSWGTLLVAIERELAGEPRTESDLQQLRGLCDAADNEAFVPISRAEVTDQRTPAFLRQLISIMDGAVKKAVAKKVLSIEGLRPQSSWERVGRYVGFRGASGISPWFGAEFTLWKDYGSTPLWLVFTSKYWGAPESRKALEPWAIRKGVQHIWRNDEFAVGIELPTGEEEEAVIDSVFNQLKEIGTVLSRLKRKRS